MTAFLEESTRLVYWVIFKPLSLSEHLDLESPAALQQHSRLYHLLTSEREVDKRLASQTLFVVFLNSLVWPVIGQVLARGLGYSLSWDDVAFNMVLGLLFGLLGALVGGTSLGISLSILVPIVGSLIADQTIEAARTAFESNDFRFSLFTGHILGLLLGFTGSVAFSRAAINWLQATSTLVSTLVFTGGVHLLTGGGASNLSQGAIFALSFFFSFAVGYTRLCLYLPQQVLQFPLVILSRYDSSHVRRYFQWSPACWDELIWFRLLALDRQLAMLYDQNAELGWEAITRVARLDRQRWAARAAVKRIVVSHIQGYGNIDQVAGAASVLDFLGSPPIWLDQPFARVAGLLGGISQEVAASRTATSDYNRLAYLNRAQGLLSEAEGAIVESLHRRTRRKLRPIVADWETIIASEIRRLTARPARVVQIPNPYIAGLPLQLDDQQIFVGREGLFRDIRSRLTSGGKSVPFLFGQRRMGKSSVLFQLPRYLPPTFITVFVDLQGMGKIKNVGTFLYVLADAIAKQTKEKDLTLPEIAQAELESEGRFAFERWLAHVAPQLDGRLLLLALDEIEQLDVAVADGKVDYETLGYLRSLIQHPQHRYECLVFLFAGSLSLSYMQPDLRGSLINTTQIKVGYLAEDSVRQLITNPVADFALDYAEPAIEAILYATRGQPFLTQLVCFNVVNIVNESRSKGHPKGTVTEADVQAAVRLALDQGQLYFEELWQGPVQRRLNPVERLVLAGLAEEETGHYIKVASLSRKLKSSRRVIKSAVSTLWKRYELIETDGDAARFQIPLVHEWVRVEKPLAIITTQVSRGTS
jgi:hypothetical protein